MVNGILYMYYTCADLKNWKWEDFNIQTGFRRTVDGHRHGLFVMGIKFLIFHIDFILRNQIVFFSPHFT